LNLELSPFKIQDLTPRERCDIIDFDS